MGTGYTRNDTANNIADANIIDAADLDGEFNAVVAAFASATGHTHDGTTAEGGVITVVGPAQEYVGAAGDFSPKADSTYDLGKTSVRWATVYIDDLDVTTNIVVGGTVDGRDVAADGTKLDAIEAAADVTDATNVTAAGALMDSELTDIASVKALDQGVATTDTPTFAGIVTGGNVDGRDVSVDGTKLDTIETGADVTDTANVTAAGALMDSEVDADIKTLVLPASTTISTFGASLVDDATAAAALVTLGVTSTAAELNALDGITATVTELNYTDGVTSAIQTQIDAKAALASPTFTGVPAAPTAATTTSTTQLATTAFVQQEITAQSLGVGQTWQNVKASRATGTAYQTTTGRPIQVSMWGDGDYSSIEVSSDNVTWVRLGSLGQSGYYLTGLCFTVPDDHYYKQGTGAVATYWAELR